MLLSLSVAHFSGYTCCLPILIYSLRYVQMPSSDYRGVCFCNTKRKWRAVINHEGRPLFAGAKHETPEAAAKALDQ